MTEIEDAYVHGPRIKNAKQILDIIAPIPAEKFIVHKFGDDEGNSCFLGHIHRSLSGFDNYHGDMDGYGARFLTANFLTQQHGIRADGATVNNSPNVNGYNEPEIKDRIVHLLNDMIEAGY